VASIVKSAPTGNRLVAEESTAKTEILPHLCPDSSNNFEGESQAGIGTASVAIITHVGPREKLRHGVGMGIVQLNPIKTCPTSTGGGLGKKPRKAER
jgi:hypothetical protein